MAPNRALEECSPGPRVDRAAPRTPLPSPTSGWTGESARPRVLVRTQPGGSRERSPPPSSGWRSPRDGWRAPDALLRGVVLAPLHLDVVVLHGALLQAAPVARPAPPRWPLA